MICPRGVGTLRRAGRRRKIFWRDWFFREGFTAAFRAVIRVGFLCRCVLSGVLIGWRALPSRCLERRGSAKAARRAARGAARGHAVTSHAGSARAARRAARKQRKKKNGQRSSSALQPIKSPECRHASAQKTRSNYSAKGSSEPLPGRASRRRRSC